MKVSQLAGVIVTSMVVILIVVSVLIPIINNNDNISYIESDNENYDYLMGKGDATYGARIILTAVGDGSATYTVGASGASTGTTMTVSGDDVRVWFCDNAIVYCTSSLMKVVSANVTATARNLSAAGDYVDFNGAGSMVAVSNPGQENENTRTSPYTWVLHPDTGGSWAFFAGSFNISKAASMYAIYMGNAAGVVGYGTATSVSQLVGNSSVTSTYTVSSTEASTYYSVSGVTITYVGSATATASALGVVAPLEYNSGTEGGADMVQMLLGIVPILIIVGVVMAVVGVYFKGRDY
jgi:hypothetical protein